MRLLSILASIALPVAMISCTQIGTSQGQIDIGEYKPAENSTAKSEEVKVVNADFSQGGFGWRLNPSCRIGQNDGVNGSPGLVYERNNQESYELCTSKTIRMKAGERYKFGVWVKGDVPSAKEPVACVALELYDGGKYAGGEYLKASPGKDWQYVEGELTAATECDAHLTLYLQRMTTGRICFDDAKIERSNFKPWLIHMLQPKMSTIASNDGAAIFKVAQFCSKTENIVAYAELVKDAKTVAKAQATTDKDGMAVFDFGKGLPCGDAIISVKALDTANKLILAEKETPVRIAQKPEAGKGVCAIDSKGRALVDGKPFLPVGLYMGDVSREDIKRLAASPFNCVVPYSSISLKFKDSKKKGLDAIREVLDELDRNNIKIIFSLKDVFDGYPKADRVWKLYGAQSGDESVKLLVETLKDHPAILAWYVCDEFGTNWIERLESRKTLVNFLDGRHPTWAVYYRFSILPNFASTCDVMGVDPYPIERPGSHGMKLVKTAMDAGDMTGNSAVWAVPQFCNLGNYNPQAKTDRAYRLKNNADPTEDEMRAMCLLMAIRGTKGFIGYSYFDLFVKCAEPDAAKRWPEVCRVGETLKELAPFILSDKTGPALKVESKKGEVCAKAFSNDTEKVKVVIAGIGPGVSEAEIIPQTALNLKSKSGLTKRLDDGRYIFRGEGICSDILE